MEREFMIHLLDREVGPIVACEILGMFPTFAKHMEFESEQNEIDFLEMALDRHKIIEDLIFFKYIDHLPRVIQVKLINSDPELVSLIQNLDEDLQFDILDDSPELISKINNLTESAIKFAVRKDADLISFFEEPTEETILVAIRENAMAIRHIREISDVVLKEALLQAADTIPFVIHLMDLDWKKFAISQHVSAIKYFKQDEYFDDVLAPMAFDLNPEEAIQSIGEFSFSYDEIIRPAVQKNPEIARLLRHVDADLQLELVHEDPRFITYINNPTEEVQQYVMEQHFLYAGLIKGDVAPGILEYAADIFKNMDDCSISNLIRCGVNIIDGVYDECNDATA